MPVDPAQVASAQGHAMAIEEFEDLDRDLAAVVDPVTKLGGGEGAVRDRFGEVGGDARHFPDGGAKEEVVVRHFVGPAHARRRA